VSDESTATLVAPKDSATIPASRFDGSIFQAAASVTTAGVVVKIIAMLKEVVVAGVYGRSDAMDAFLVAFLIPNLLVNIIAESMNQALMPTLVRVRLQQGAERAQELMSNAMLRMVLLLGMVSAAMAVTARFFFPLIAWGFPATKVELSVRMFWMLLPMVLFTGIASNCAAVLNTMERFALPALAPAMVPLCVAAGALLLHRQLGIWALVVLTLVGSAAHAAVVVWSMSARGFLLRLQWRRTGEETSEVVRQYGPVLLSSVVASGGLLVDQAMAAALPAGSVSTMVFASRFVGVVLTLLAGGVSSAFAPYFSIMVAQSDWDSCRSTLRKGTLISASVAAPIAAFMILGARPLVHVTLQHGAFGPQDAAEVASVLAMFAIQIPFYAASRVDYRFVLAMRRTDLVLYCGIINLILDVVLDLLLMRYMGVAGLALATSLWTISTWAFFRICARRLLAHAQASSAAAGVLSRG
jgi:putative peptidoglycan lipid II flippase